MTDNKGIGSKFTPGVTPPITAQPAPTQPLPVQPAPAAPDSAAATPTGSTSAASPSTPPPAPGAHGRRRPRRPVADPHAAPATPAAPPATPAPAAPAPADSDDEPEGSADTENVVTMTEAEWRKKLEEEKAEEAEKKRKNRFTVRAWAWLRKTLKKLGILAVVILALVGAWQLWGPDWGKDTATAPEPKYSAPKGIMPGGDEGSQRGSKADNAPTVKDNGDNKVFEYTDPNYKAVTFKVITDEELNITEVKLGEKLKEYGGKLSIGTVDGSQESDVRCSRNAQACDFSAEKISICKSWLSLYRIVPVQGGTDQNQPFWTALEVYNATPTGTYSGSTDLPHFCGVKDSDTSS